MSRVPTTPPQGVGGGGTGGSGTAADTTVDTTNFDGLLSSADSDMQTALETIDGITIGFTNYVYVAKNGDDSDGDGSAGKPYLTVSAAITTSSSGTTIIIMPGTYVEDITFKAGVYLTSPVKFGVYITGNHVCSFSGTCIVDGIILQSATGDTITTSGSNVFNLQILGGSSVNSGTGHAINWQATNAAAHIYFEDGTCNVTTSGASACCVYSTTGAAGYIIANRVSFQLNSAANIALSLGGALAFTHTSDVIYGQVVVSGTASAAIALVHMTASGAAVLTTNSSGTTVLTEAVITTGTSPAIDGAGIFAFMALTYTSSGVGGAATLNGGYGASPLVMAPIRLRSSTLLPAASVAAGLLDGTFEHDSTGLWWTQGTSRVRIDIPVINELTAETSIADGDFVAIYDVSVGAIRKMTKANFVAGLSAGSVATDTIWDAAGDLVVGTGANTAARMAMGTALQQLRVNSAGTGLEFATISAPAASTLVQRSLEGAVYETTLMYWPCPKSGTISSISMHLGSAPSAAGSYCKVQVMKNGLLETNSVFTSDAAMQVTETTSAVNGIYPANGTLDSGQTALAAGDVLWFRVNQADTGSADLLVQTEVTFT